MSMVPTRQVDARTAKDLADTLARLRDARADGPPDHDPHRCVNCRICVAERMLNRMLDRLQFPKNMA